MSYSSWKMETFVKVTIEGWTAENVLSSSFQLMFSPICIGSCLLVAGLVEQQEKERLKSDIIEQGELSGYLDLH